MKGKKLKKVLYIVIGLGVFFLLFFVFVLKSSQEKNFSNHLSLPLSPDSYKVEKKLSKRGDLNIIAGGDIMLSRQVNAQMEKRGDYLWPFEKIASTTSAADISIANLESPFIKGANYDVPTGSFMFKVNPQAAAGLAFAGFDFLSLANNHSMNMGAQGIKDTESVLSSRDIAYAGAGMNETLARKGAILERKGWKIGILSYAYPNDASVAASSSPGIASMDENNLKQDIKRLRAEDKVSLVIVMMHAGQEYSFEPNSQQISFAHAAINDGADIVIGSHPHWPQKTELYHGHPIIYSLGNLVFDQMWSEGTSRSVLADIIFHPDGSGQINFIPFLIKGYGQAQLYNGDINDFFSVYNQAPLYPLSWPAPSGN